MLRCLVSAPSQVCPVPPLGSRSQAEILLADVNHSASQEDLVSSWEPAHSFVEDAGLWGRDCPLPSGSGCCIPASLPLAGGRGWGGMGGEAVCSQLALLWYSFSPLFCERARLETFAGKFSLFSSLSLWLSHSLGCCLTLAPSDCPQGIQAWSLP